jgi:hypothetical protein
MQLEGLGAAILGGGSDADAVATMHGVSRCTRAAWAACATTLQCSRRNSWLHAVLQGAAAHAVCCFRRARTRRSFTSFAHSAHVSLVARTNISCSAFCFLDEVCLLNPPFRGGSAQYQRRCVRVHQVRLGLLFDAPVVFGTQCVAASTVFDVTDTSACQCLHASRR